MEFEEAFGRFIERQEYDSAEDALFGMARAAFQAGWAAAEENSFHARPSVRLVCRKTEDREESAETAQHSRT